MVCTFYRLRLNDKTVFTEHVTGSFVCGSAVLIPLAGLLCEYGFDGGWPSVFYVFGLYSLFRRHVSWTVVKTQSPDHDQHQNQHHDCTFKQTASRPST